MSNLTLPPTSGAPTIIDQEAAARFRSLAEKMGLDADSLWVGGYVGYEWNHFRHVFETSMPAIESVKTLEVGCNYGASAIVMAQLGAHVTAVDVDPNNIELAKANAAMYGVNDRITFLYVPDTTSMPFPNESFDLVNCNSVLEYVPPSLLRPLLQEIDRVLKHGGMVLVSGTSNRLWPVEMHSHKWFVNYLPRHLDKFILGGRAVERGIFPWQLHAGFRHYVNVDRATRGKAFLETKARIGLSRRRLLLLKVLNSITRAAGIWMGYITPSLTVTLKKP